MDDNEGVVSIHTAIHIYTAGCTAAQIFQQHDEYSQLIPEHAARSFKSTSRYIRLIMQMCDLDREPSQPFKPQGY
jgi:hypothetical protein